MPNARKTADRAFCFLVMFALGHTDRKAIERAVERYAEGPEAALRDGQREKARQRELWARCMGRNPWPRDPQHTTP